MAPKRGKKKQNNSKDDDQDFGQNRQVASKWAQLLQQGDQKEADAEQIYSKPNKAVFDYDFSQVKDRQEPPKVMHKPKDAELTPKEKEELERVRQKARIDKGEKEKVKQERKEERQKALGLVKARQQVEKEKEAEEEKRVQQEITKNKRKQPNHLLIPTVLLVSLVLMGVLQYQKEIHERLARFRFDEQKDLYEVLESHAGATDSELKSNYKQLVLKYHPDRNTDCQDCSQRFEGIMQAWEVLGDAEKRSSYDQNSGYVSQIRSSAVTLSPRNYQHLVQEGGSVWVVQVYDSTSEYSRHFGQFWEQLVQSLGDVIRFGRVDVWRQADMLSYLPYRFQVFPAVYIVDGGRSEICSLDHRTVLSSLKRCIEEVFDRTEFEILPEEPKASDLRARSTEQRPVVTLSGRLRANMRIKAINKIFADSYDFLFLSPNSNSEAGPPRREAKIFFFDRESPAVFEFGDSSKKGSKQYRSFLENYTVRRMSVCRFLDEWEDGKCAILLSESKMEEARKAMPLSKGEAVPLIFLTDWQEQLDHEVERIKNATGQHEDFDLGVYTAGRIELGYLDEVEQLAPDQGELLLISCRVHSWMQTILNLISRLGAVF